MAKRTMKDVCIDISGLDKTALLRDLYNAATLYEGSDGAEMTKAEAEEIWHTATSSPHIHGVVRGRVLKIDLSGELLDPRWYDRHNGKGKCAEVVDALR